MGLLDTLKKIIADAQEKSRQKELAIAEQRRIDSLNSAFYEDTYTQGLMKEYYGMLEKIESKYKELNQNKDFSSRKGTNLITTCNQAIRHFRDLVPRWEFYEEPIPLCPVYARLAMIYEKRGDYIMAAETCVEAIEAGFDDDGTKGGMKARLRRMIKKGGFNPTSEMENALLETITIIE